MSQQLRGIANIVKGSETSDGAGVRLCRYIASPELDMLDPFLLLDAFRSDNPDDYIAGFPPHPHRGFETVTYLLHGAMRHKDSAGHEGVIRSGGVQWMTAARGIEHSEMPEQVEGLLYGFQLWVNLPANKKMSKPRYQEFEPDEMAIEQRNEDTKIRVISGVTASGVEGMVKNIESSPLYLDVELAEGAVFTENIELGHNAFVFLVSGELMIYSDAENDVLQSDQLAVLTDGNQVKLEAKLPSRFLLIAGKPFNEPVARYGPFVMNTEEEIKQAFIDYRAGDFGSIN
jgi:quercetin 2,3-dioxygenase